jgi:hypothetical protein
MFGITRHWKKRGGTGRREPSIIKLNLEVRGMKSHEYARKMQELAEKLLAKPEFDTLSTFCQYFYFFEKDKFVDCVKALGSGRKEFLQENVYFRSQDGLVTACIARDRVCRKVKEAEWECDPIFAADELAELIPEEE